KAGDEQPIGGAAIEHGTTSFRALVRVIVEAECPIGFLKGYGAIAEGVAADQRLFASRNNMKRNVAWCVPGRVDAHDPRDYLRPRPNAPQTWLGGAQIALRQADQIAPPVLGDVRRPVFGGPEVPFGICNVIGGIGANQLAASPIRGAEEMIGMRM